MDPEWFIPDPDPATNFQVPDPYPIQVNPKENLLPVSAIFYFTLFHSPTILPTVQNLQTTKFTGLKFEIKC